MDDGNSVGLNPRPPSKELLGLISKVYEVSETLEEAWNLAIDEREEAPIGEKSRLRKIVNGLEAMLHKFNSLKGNIHEK